MLCHRFTPIIRQRFPHRGRDLPKLLGTSLVRPPAICTVHEGQEDKLGGLLDPCADSLEPVRAPLRRLPSQGP